MASVNKAIIIGNVGSDPESRDTANSTVCNFSVATSEKFNDKEQTEWHRVVAWGKTAEACQRYLSKGSSVYIEGRIQTRQWEKDGQTKYTTEIVAQRVQFLGGKPQSEKRQEPKQDDQIADASDFPF